MVVTPFGVVLCSDSLVSTTSKRTVVKDTEQLKRMKYSDFHAAFPNLIGSRIPPPYLLDENNIGTESEIITTSSDVKKIFQVADFPIGLSFAGDAMVTYSTIDMGKGRFVEAPIETFVKTIVKDVVKSRFTLEDYKVHDVGLCISLALTAGLSAKEVSGVNIHIIGGGFSSNDVFPRSFDFNLSEWHTNSPRGEYLAGSGHWLRQALTLTLPLRASSRNWFEEFLKSDLADCVELCLCNAWWWALSSDYQEQVIKDQVIPDVSQMICSSIGILGEILSDNPMDYLSQEKVSFADIIGRMWDLRKRNYESKWNDVVLEAVRDCRVGEKIFQLWGAQKDLYHSNKAVDEFQKSIYSRIIDRTWDFDTSVDDSSYHSRLPEDVRMVLPEDEFNTLYFLVQNYIKPTVFADQILNSEPGHVYTNYLRGSAPNISCVGQTETVDRIMYGIDWETDRKIKREVNRFQMHNVMRMGEIVLRKWNNLELNEPPEFKFYGKGKGKGKGNLSFSADSSDTGDDSDSEQTDLNRYIQEDSVTNKDNDLVGEGGKEPLEFVIPEGNSEWKGVISSSEGSRYRCNLAFNSSRGASEDSDFSAKISFHGYIDIPNAMDIMISGECSNQDLNGSSMNFRLTFDEMGKIEQCEATSIFSEFGLELSISEQELKEENKLRWETIILIPGESGQNFGNEESSNGLATIDDNFIKESTSLIYAEIQDFEMPYSTSRWNVDYRNMPISRAVSLAEYLIDSTIKKQIFNSEIPTVGGDILTATISFDDGFKFL